MLRGILGRLIIKGESDGDCALSFIQQLSKQYPTLTIEIQGTELQNGYSQRWIFEAGEGQLRDCIQEADNDEPRIDYMVNGVQFVPLPDWVPAIDDVLEIDGEQTVKTRRPQ